MDIVNSSVDLARILFLFGAVLALLYKKKFGVTPGGIIVPGIMTSILFEDFVAFVVVLINCAICWLIYKVLISNYALSNRWNSLVNISVSVIISLIAAQIFTNYHILGQTLLLLSMVVPGLVTISAKKYTMPKVTFATISVTTVVAILGIILSKIIPYEQLGYIGSRLTAYPPLELTHPSIVLPISLLTAILIYYRFGIRGGGYLIAPFMAVLIVTAPLQAALVAIGVFISYWVVRLIQKHTLVIGLERFVLSLFCGYLIVSIIDLLAITFNFANYRPSVLIPIIAIAVYTNDLTLQPAGKTFAKGLVPATVIALVARLAV